MPSRFTPPFTPTYEGANEYLNAGRSKDTRRIGKNARLERMPNGSIYFFVYNTAIVSYFSDGRIEIFCGRWQTNTTKRYINVSSPAHVSQKDFVWYVDGKPWDGSILDVTPLL